MIQAIEMTVPGTSYRLYLRVPQTPFYEEDNSVAKDYRKTLQKLSRPEFKGAKFMAINADQSTAPTTFAAVANLFESFGVNAKGISGPRAVKESACAAPGKATLQRRETIAAKVQAAQAAPQPAAKPSPQPAAQVAKPSVQPAATGATEIIKLVGKVGPFGRVTQVFRVVPSVWEFRAENGSGYKVDFRKNTLVPEAIRHPKGWYPSGTDLSSVINAA